MKACILFKKIGSFLFLRILQGYNYWKKTMKIVMQKLAEFLNLRPLKSSFHRSIRLDGGTDSQGTNSS